MKEERVGTNNIEITDATSDDVDGIKEVQAVTWLATYPNKEEGITEEDVNQQLNSASREDRYKRLKETVNQDDKSHTYVAKEGDKVVGFCTSVRGEKNRIGAIYVLPEYQGTGVGGRLMGVSLQWSGFEKDVYVNVARYNHNAINFYKRFGFVETGEIPTDDVAKLPSGKVIPEIEMVKRKGD